MSSREDKDNIVDIILPTGTTKLQKREPMF